MGKLFIPHGRLESGGVAVNANFHCIRLLFTVSYKDVKEHLTCCRRVLKLIDTDAACFIYYGNYMQLIVSQ